MVSPLGGSFGKIDNTMLTGVLRYKFGNGFSAHGGIRSSWTRGEVGLPFANNYEMTTNTDQAFGYLLGIAYEMPEIALRVALTYNSKIKHGFDATERVQLPDMIPTAAVLENPMAASFDTTFNTNLPQSINLEFQTGVAEGTLVFGSVRWVNWKDFRIEPTVFQSDPTRAPLVAYAKNSVTYTLGVGRQFNENWSGSLSVAHDTGNGRITGNLGPVGKRNSIGVGLSYTQDAMTISGGVQYSRIGSVQTTLQDEAGNRSSFGNNSAIGAGIRVGFRF